MITQEVKSLKDRFELKAKKQREALNKWYLAGFRGSIIAGTGFGKTKCGVDAAWFPITKNSKHKSIILVPTTDLITQWKEEAKKFGYGDIVDEVEIVCFASARKYLKKHYDTVVIDEVHLCLSEQNFKFFQNNTYSRILGLTATLPEDPVYRMRLVNLAKPVFNLTLDESVELGLVAPYKIFLLPVKFNKKEQEEYDSIQARFRFLQTKLGFENSFSNAQSMLSGTMDATSEEKGFAAAFLKIVGKRKELLHNNQRKLAVVKALNKHYTGEKIIVFNGTNAFSDKLEKHLPSAKSWHSGLTKKERVKRLEEFKEGKFDVFSTTKAANQGLSIDDVFIGVINGLTSKTITMIQRVGRLLRITEDKEYGIIVIPYVKDTQEEKWLKYSLAKLKGAKNITKLSDIWK